MVFSAVKKALEAVGVLKKTDFDSKIDISLSSLRDALKGTDNKDFSTLEADVESILAQLDITLSAHRDAITDLFKPVSNSGSIASANNTAGLTVELNTGGRPFVNVYYNLGGAGDIYIEVSLDGATWRTLDRISLSAAGESVEQYPWVAYPYVRARVPTTGIDVTLEIVASR